jgi:hypothetical protein
MPRVLTTNAIITCPHGGIGTTVPAAPILNIDGGFVVRDNDAGVLSCVFVPPCVGYTLRSMGLNTTELLGAPAVLETDFNQTLTGLPLLIQETQQALTDDSAPGPGGLSAEMLDNTPPVVAAVPPALAFNSVTGLPVTGLTTFNLSAQHPLKWILTRVSLPPNAGTADLTGGAPGAVVAPSGGDWGTPAQAVTLTMTAAFMAALGPGVHQFYMTAVTKRGISAHTVFTLTVT